METHDHDNDNDLITGNDPDYTIGLYLHGGIGYYKKKPGSGSDEKGFFTFLRAMYDQRFYEEDPSLCPEAEIPLQTRCDSSAPKTMPVPTSLHDQDPETGLCTFCGSSEPVYGTTNSHYSSLTNAKVLRMPFHGYKGFIGYLELVNPEIEELEVYSNANMARTLQELFRLMLEWEWVYDNLDSTDTCAILAHNMLEEMELPQSIRDWLWNEVPDMHVAKFLQGDLDARARPDTSTIPEMTPEFEGWCWYQIVDKPTLWQYGPR